MKNSNRHALAAAAAACLGAAAPAASAQGLAAPDPDLVGAMTAGEVRHDLSPRLQDVVPLHQGRAHRLVPLGRLPIAPDNDRPDAALQTAPPGPLAPAPVGRDLQGLGEHFPGFLVNTVPSDANGAAGATQYVQWVNQSFVIFDKASGNPVYGPAAGNTLWHGFGGQCEQNNDGDPIVQYDKAANRWVLTQFAVTNGPPFYQCVAVSTTSDARGPYHRYAFQYAGFPDYTKLSVWPDAYYITFNNYGSDSATYLGPRACALDRKHMLAGAAATQQCFQLAPRYGALLAADLDGATPPPAGAPEVLLGLGQNALLSWKFHVDWTHPANAFLHGPVSLAVAGFSKGCNGGVCIPQPGTAQQLDSLGDRLMFRLAYRNLGTQSAPRESLVVSHTVQVNAGKANTRTGVRWYELGLANGTPHVKQQGTFSPDTSSRWMSSIAMDRIGDIAVGYSVSSGTVHPTIRFTAREPGDPLGRLQAEASSINGTVYGSGSQLDFNRWGDYSSMRIDPVDDCTFWYTNQYLNENGSFNWDTRIVSFRFPECH